MDQLNVADKIGLALKRAVSFVEQADLPADAPLPLSGEDLAARIIELLETVHYNEMAYQDLHRQRLAGHDKPKGSGEWLNAQACKLMMNWRSLLTTAHITPGEVIAWNTGSEPERRVEPIPEKLTEDLKAHIDFFNGLSDEAKKRYLTLESPEFEAHIEALIDGTATQCFYNQQLRANASPWGDWGKK